ncbi:MAG: formylglycine-generating enzyme family protein, partial [Planctomycetes bacterium]|nr:formylglycine-generating enzyme family protein [Planctomycetota bacterium]
WIDLNVPAAGTWGEVASKQNTDYNHKRRREMLAAYSTLNIEDFVDVEKVVNPYEPSEFIMPASLKAPTHAAAASTPTDWPLGARAKVQGAYNKDSLNLDMGQGVSIEFQKIPAGSFIMGSTHETPQEQPLHKVSISKPFWMASTEVTVKQYALFDKEHNNGVYDQHYKDQVRRGYFVHKDNYPVIRVTWEKAQKFCQWLSEKTGKKVSLPTEAQWEWACRAGEDHDFWFGEHNTDYSKFANLADSSMSQFAVKGVDPKPIKNPTSVYDFIPKDTYANDGALLLADVKTYKANPWGLYDMHGNVAEWTRSEMADYPYNELSSTHADRGQKVVRGGSWRDRAKRATASYRLAYPSWQKVYNVGFRVIIED